MPRLPKDLSRLFKSPIDLRVAGDYLQHQFRRNPGWLQKQPETALGEFPEARHDPDDLREWCERWLTHEQLRTLASVIRLTARQQRVYKRTVMLSPCAHLLLKTLSELEGLKLSEVLEVHLDRILQERHGRQLCIRVDDENGRIDFDIGPVEDSAPDPAF